jgi:hypothetical protein
MDDAAEWSWSALGSITAVNRLVADSNPARGAITKFGRCSLKIFPFFVKLGVRLTVNIPVFIFFIAALAAACDLLSRCSATPPSSWRGR